MNDELFKEEFKEELELVKGEVKAAISRLEEIIEHNSPYSEYILTLVFLLETSIRRRKCSKDVPKWMECLLASIKECCEKEMLFSPSRPC